jgi:hypothetical protein
MSKDYSYYQYEVLLTSAKITKPERFKDSDLFVASDMSDYQQEHKVISKEKHDQILTLLKGEETAKSTKQQRHTKLKKLLDILGKFNPEGDIYVYLAQPDNLKVIDEIDRGLKLLDATEEQEKQAQEEEKNPDIKNYEGCEPLDHP